MDSHRLRLDRLKELVKEGSVSADEPLAPYTTYHLGGRADFMVVPQNNQGLSQTIRFCFEEGLPLYVLGRGSNLLVSDAGVRGAVVNMAAMPGQTLVFEEKMEVCAGCSLASLLAMARSHSLGGLEELVGIPGTVGGAVITNAGAYGINFLDRACRIELITREGKPLTLKGNIPSQYRSSPLENQEIVTRVTLKLQERKKGEITAKMRELAHKRKFKIPYREKQAGSVFKNPPRDFAGRLIEEAGLKGKRYGGAVVSPLHANFIINDGATADQVLALIRIIQEEVWKRTGVKLELELHLWFCG